MHYAVAGMSVICALLVLAVASLRRRMDENESDVRRLRGEMSPEQEPPLRDRVRTLEVIVGITMRALRKRKRRSA